MKLNPSPAAALAITTLCGVSFSNASLIITGLGDPDGGTGDILELYATSAIADLSTFGLEKTANANTSGGSPSISLPAVALAKGGFYYVTTDDEDFSRFFGFDADFQWGSLSINGDDAVLLYENGTLVDVVLEDGNDDDVHGDGWIYRNDTEGPGTSFVAGEWTIAPNTLGSSNDDTNAASATPMPIGSYAVPEPSSALLSGFACLALLRRRRRA